MAQFARPDSNITQTAFTGGFADIDEITPADADRAWSTDGVDAELEVGLSNVTDPGVSTGHVFRYRVAKTDDGTLSSTGNAKSCIVRLLQGTTVIATDTERTLDTFYTQYERTLSGAEADAITDYTDLRLEVTTVGGGGNPSNRRGMGISWAEFEVPDANIPATANAGLQTLVSSLFTHGAYPGVLPLAPDGSADISGFIGAHTAVDEEFHIPDGLSMGRSGTSPQIARFTFPTPAEAPLGTQTFKVRITPNLVFASNHANPHSVTLSLYEAGVLVASLAELFPSGSGQQVLVADWEASLLSDPTGADVELRVDTSGGGHIDGTGTYMTDIDTVGWQVGTTSDGTGTGNADLQVLAASVLAASGTGESLTEAGLQTVASSLLTASAGGKGQAAADLQSLVASVLGASPVGGATVTAGLVGAAASIFTASPTGAGQTTAALLTVPVSLLDPTAQGGGSATADLLVTVTSPFDADALGKALAQADLLSLGITQFAATAGVIGYVEAALQTMTGSVLTVDAKGAAEASAVMQSVAMSLLASGATGAAQADAALLATSAAVLASEAHGGGSVQSGLLTASVAVLEALALGSALANAPMVSADFSIFQPTVSGGGSATANADLVSMALTALDPTATGGAEVVAALVAAAWSVHAATAGGGSSAQADADLLLMALSQFAGVGAGGARVVPGLLGTEVSTFAVQSRGAAQVTAGLQSANWSLFDASAGGGQSAIANAALLVVGMVLNNHVATGQAIGLAGVAGLVSEALDAIATGAGLADAGSVSLSVTLFEPTAGVVIRNFEGAATATLSLTARGSVSLSLEATGSLEVAA